MKLDKSIALQLAGLFTAIGSVSAVTMLHASQEDMDALCRNNYARAQRQQGNLLPMKSSEIYYAAPVDKCSNGLYHWDYNRLVINPTLD